MHSAAGRALAVIINLCVLAPALLAADQPPLAPWRPLPPLPDLEGYLFSGAHLRTDTQGRPVREYLRDAWRYRPGSGWRRLADLPRAAVAAPAPALHVGDGRLLILSGDDGTKVHFQPILEHPGFPRDVLAYVPAQDSWTKAGEVPFSRATAPTAKWRGMLVVVSGEARPGFRSPGVWTTAGQSSK
jgi:N-acetylneuraminate epimerase